MGFIPYNLLTHLFQNFIVYFMLNNNNLKTFFLFPQKLIFEDIAEVLITEQNEAFVLNNHVEFKEALSIFNEKTIAFINIDSVLSEAEWIEYVRFLKEDTHFSRIKIGILSFNPDPRLMNIYQKELKIDCGYHILSRKNRKYEEDIKKLVSSERLKTGNKILRLDFEKIDPVQFSIKENSNLIEGSIDAMSSAAMSITLDNDRILHSGMELNNIFLSFRDSNCKITGVVAGNSQLNKNQFIIKFSSFYLDIHQNPISSILHTVLDKKMRELVK